MILRNLALIFACGNLSFWNANVNVNAFVPSSRVAFSASNGLLKPTITTTTTTSTIPSTTSVSGRHLPPSCVQTSGAAGSSSTQLAFMGSDGGILGIGTPELFTILLVGYFVLGPSDLYKLVKEIGKFIQNVQTFSREATASIENNLESNLQMEEIRKAQRELNDAFSFRRSINVDEDSEAFEVNARSERTGISEGSGGSNTAVAASASGGTGAVAAASTGTADEAAAVVGKKKIRRRRRKKTIAELEEEENNDEMPVFNNDAFSSKGQTQQTLANNVPDLDIDDLPMSEAEERAMKSMQEANEALRREMEAEEAARKRRQERLDRLSKGSSLSDMDKEAMMAKQEMGFDSGYDASVMSPSDAQSRFQAQLSGSWNEKIIAKDEELAPLAKLMEQLALLEEEKNANDARLQEEFRRREENEERYYREKRKLLEEAAAKIQAEAYAGNSSATSSTNTNTTTAVSK